MLSELPDASPDLVRALLVAHARAPNGCADLFDHDADASRALIGYGQVDRSALHRSLETCVTLWAEERIGNRQHQFFEIPIPDELWAAGRRAREITVALAYRPAVRTTRIDYRAAAIGFKLVQSGSLEDVAQWFNAAVDREALEAIPELTSGRGLTEQVRSRGTVQASTWTIRQASPARRQRRWFVVVTRNDPPWGTTLSDERERYALVVTVADRDAPEPRLYSRIQARLQARVRVRV